MDMSKELSGWTAVMPYPGGRGPPDQEEKPASPSLRSGTNAKLLAWALLLVPPVRAGNLPATGQTTVYQADKNNGVGLDAVPDDGTLQRGATLHYKLLKDGTIKDLNTGLIWEMKCTGAGCAALHDVGNTYP